MIERRNPSTHLALIATLLSACAVVACGNDGSLTAPTTSITASPTIAPVGVSTITGRVTESTPTTRAGIAHATVYVEDGKLLGPIATTDDVGFYSITGLKTGLVTISVLADHYKSVSAPLALTGDTTMNFQLTPMAESK